MDPHTLTFYTIAAGFSFCLSLLLVMFAHIQRGTLLVNSLALTMMAAALALFVAGQGPQFPKWVTVIGTNALLLSAAVILHAGFVAFAEERTPRIDYPGWTLIALTLPLFAYWGLVEPDGSTRSMLFSFAAALIVGRTARLLAGLARRRHGWMPLRVLVLVFGVLTAWMLLRGVYFVFAPPPPVELKGANPTQWMTVFWFNVLIAVLVASLLALEIHRLRPKLLENASERDGSLEPLRANLNLLWSLVAVILIAIATEVGIIYTALYQREYRQLEAQAGIANQAFAEHSQQIVTQADLMLRAVRNMAERGVPAAELDRFISDLKLSRTTFEDLFIIGADGRLIAPIADRAKGIDTRQRDYFRFHLEHAEDVLYISPISTGLVSGKQQFRVTRRLADVDGRFAGVVLIPLEPMAFTRYFRQLQPGADNIATLIGTEDRRIRARVPEAEPAKLDAPLESQLWDALATAPTGKYYAASAIDSIERQLLYRRVGDLPLVMVTGFSSTDVRRHALQSLQPIAFGAGLTIAIVLALATIITSILRHRDEQESFISMLSHELKTPLSVIRMALDGDRASLDKARIVRAVRSMQDVITRCVQADRLKVGLTPTRFTEINVETLLDTLWDEAPDRIELSTASLAPCHTDPDLLRIILGNLVDNALKYGDPQQPIILNAAPAIQQGKTGIRIAVANATGAAGKPDAERVFRKYYRAKSARGKTGSGLGLYIAAGFARLLGGELRYEPDDPMVRFVLWIPQSPDR